MLGVYPASGRGIAPDDESPAAAPVVLISDLVNDQSDRIFLAHDHGLGQCLREIDAKEPTIYRKPAEKNEPATAEAKAAATPAKSAESPETGGPAAAAL